MNPMIATTLMEENQNSNSPNERVGSRLMPMRSMSSNALRSQTGRGTQACSNAAPANASTDMVTIHMYQYSHPTTKPIPGPVDARTRSVKAWTPGEALASSPIMAMTAYTIAPAMR